MRATGGQADIHIHAKYMTTPRCRSDILRDLKPDDRALTFHDVQKEALAKRSNRRCNHARTNIAGFTPNVTNRVLLVTISLHLRQSVNKVIKTLYN